MWRRITGKSLSLDFRSRTVRFVKKGSSCHLAAAKFDASASCVIKLMNCLARTGSLRPARQGRPPGKQLDAHRDFLIDSVKGQPDIIMPELSERLREAHGLEADPAVSHPLMWQPYVASRQIM